jgi:U11/U12 small nuclear ribonucleoprotein SNRNP65
MFYLKPVSNTYDRQVIPATNGFPRIIPADKKLEEFTRAGEQSQEATEEEPKFISKSDLERNRLKLAELKELAVYKGYERGEPNSRIYLKNVHKDVVEADLKFIYGRFIDWTCELHRNSFDIRLMKEGRMKGSLGVFFWVVC